LTVLRSTTGFASNSKSPSGESYGEELRGGTRAPREAAKLGLSQQEVELHRLVLQTHDRLGELAGELAARQTALNESEDPNPWPGSLDPIRQENRQQAFVSMRKAKHAGLQAESLRLHFPRLFGVVPNPYASNLAAWDRLPLDIRRKLDDIRRETQRRELESEIDAE
jgi:sugar phosphate isomerase/epimerase